MPFHHKCVYMFLFSTFAGPLLADPLFISATLGPLVTFDAGGPGTIHDNIDGIEVIDQGGVFSVSTIGRMLAATPILTFGVSTPVSASDSFSVGGTFTVMTTMPDDPDFPFGSSVLGNLVIHAKGANQAVAVNVIPGSPQVTATTRGTVSVAPYGDFDVGAALATATPVFPFLPSTSGGPFLDIFARQAELTVGKAYSWSIDASATAEKGAGKGLAGSSAIAGYDATTIEFKLTLVPEPATMTLVGIAVGLLFCIRRRPWDLSRGPRQTNRP